MEIMSAAQWSALLLALTTGIVAIIRVYIKTSNSSSSESTATKLTNELLVNLNNEIKRLETIIIALSNEVNTLKNNINSLRNLENHAAHDFGSLESTLKSMKCVNCSERCPAYERLIVLVDRMSARREERHAIIDMSVID